MIGNTLEIPWKYCTIGIVSGYTNLKILRKNVFKNDFVKNVFFRIDLEGGISEYKFNIPSLVVLANAYELRGKLMNISMFGNGLANITLGKKIHKNIYKH